jgi:hypothetical protein
MLVETKTATRVQVFCSYAHKDEPYRQLLEPSLQFLKRQGLIDYWHDRQLEPGVRWRDVLDEQLDKADIILLLVSRYFLSSDFCQDVELKRSLERLERQSVRVIPIIVSASGWSETRLGELQALPTGGREIDDWPSKEKAFFDIERGISRVALEVRNRKNTKLLERVNEAQQVQSQLMDVLRLILPVVIPSEARIHLRNLVEGTCDGYIGRSSLRRELRQLRSMQLITMRNGRRIGDFVDGMACNLSDFVMLTEVGKFWIGRIKEIEGLDNTDD